MCRLNANVDTRNIILITFATESEQYSIKASDAIAGQNMHIDLSTLSDKRFETQYTTSRWITCHAYN